MRSHQRPVLIGRFGERLNPVAALPQIVPVGAAQRPPSRGVENLGARRDDCRDRLEPPVVGEHPHQRSQPREAVQGEPDMGLGEYENQVTVALPRQGICEEFVGDVGLLMRTGDDNEHATGRVREPLGLVRQRWAPIEPLYAGGHPNHEALGGGTEGGAVRGGLHGHCWSRW